ncbi:MAG: c-type cytochrome [Chloroflexi bacterium]|nr:c-type cytochrome [Chloroflexota bacterium]
MKKVFKWIGIVIGSLVGLILLSAVGLFAVGSSRLNKTYDFPPSGIAIPTDKASLERGRHLTNMMCTGCHGSDLGGVEKWFADDALGRVDAPNLTSGAGGEGAEFESDEDWARVIRHGVDPEGKPIFMPAVTAFAHLSNEDLGAIIAYIKTVPPVNRQTEERNFTALTKILIGAGMFKLPAETVSHDPNPVAPRAGVTVEYGEYLVNIMDCKSCHGENLAGGAFPDPSVTAPVPNITPGGSLAQWSEQDFFNAMKTGVTPRGNQMNPLHMPWKEIGLASDDELIAIWLFLESLPSLP